MSGGGEEASRLKRGSKSDSDQSSTLVDEAPSRRELTASAAVILGLLEQAGPQTTYDLNLTIETMIGHYWTFPTSQMYAEAKRLEASGLVSVAQEEFGRRRRVLSLTDEGRDVLVDWLNQPTDHPAEIRDVGLLKLFFSGAGDDEQLRSLATDRLEYHQAKLALYRQYEVAFGSESGWNVRPLQMGLRYEAMALEFWSDVLTDVDKAR